MSDYLWDKSGEDRDVEALERSLGALRFDEEPPALEAPARRRPVTPQAEARFEAPARASSPVSLRGKTPLLLALAMGLLAGVLSYSALQRREAEVRAGWNLVPVVVANVEISEGTVLTMDMVSQRSIPEKFVTSSVVKPDSASYVVGQKVLVPLAAGDPLLWSQFETTRSLERLSNRIVKAARAITIDAKAVTAVGGWVRPNDHVDIIGTFKDPASGEQVAVTMMQNVIVIATGRITGSTNINLLPEGQREYNHVSLMVMPEEAEMLVLSQELGGLTLSLRNEEDLGFMEDRGRATIQTLLSGERTKVLQQKRFNTIQVIRGSTAPKGQ